jgi:hypothetical protein
MLENETIKNSKWVIKIISLFSNSICVI